MLYLILNKLIWCIKSARLQLQIFFSLQIRFLFDPSVNGYVLNGHDLQTGISCHLMDSFLWGGCMERSNKNRSTRMDFTKLCSTKDKMLQTKKFVVQFHQQFSIDWNPPLRAKFSFAIRQKSIYFVFECKWLLKSSPGLAAIVMFSCFFMFDKRVIFHRFIDWVPGSSWLHRKFHYV